MSIDLIRRKILDFAYPSKNQLKLWKKEHQNIRNKLIGVKNLKCFNISICPLCIMLKFSIFNTNINDSKIKRDFNTLKWKFKNHFTKIIELYPQECNENTCWATKNFETFLT